MYLRTLTWMAVMTFLAALCQPDNLVAQSQQEQPKKDNRSYSITDLGTLGGNNSIPQAIDDRGQVAGFAETSDTDPNCGCPIFHAFRWSRGVLHDLGTLGGMTARLAWEELIGKERWSGIPKLQPSTQIIPPFWRIMPSSGEKA